MDFGGGDQVDGELAFVEDGEDFGEEAVRDGPFVGVHVYDYYFVLDGDCGRPLRCVP